MIIIEVERDATRSGVALPRVGPDIVLHGMHTNDVVHAPELWAALSWLFTHHDIQSIHDTSIGMLDV